jgi:hypothetical protein
MYTLPGVKIPSTVTIDKKLQISIKEMLFEKGYFSVYYYPYDLYTYMIALEKHIENKKITDALASISVDCMFTNSSIRSNDGGRTPVSCHHTVSLDDRVESRSTFRYDHINASIDILIGVLKKELTTSDYLYIPDLIVSLQQENVLPGYINKNDVPGLLSESIRIIVKRPSSNETDVHMHIIKKTISCPGTSTEQKPITVQGYAELIGSILFFRVYEIEHITDEIMLSGYTRMSLMNPSPHTPLAINTACSYSNFIDHSKTSKKRTSFGYWFEKQT